MSSLFLEKIKTKQNILEIIAWTNYLKKNSIIIGWALPKPPARVDKRNILDFESFELNESIIFYLSITDVVPSSLSNFQIRNQNYLVTPKYLNFYDFFMLTVNPL